MSKTRRRRPVVTGTFTFPKIEPPWPGTWRAMQTHAGKVIQWAWTCRECRTTEYVLNDPPRAMSGQRDERCPNCGWWNQGIVG